MSPKSNIIIISDLTCYRQLQEGYPEDAVPLPKLLTVPTEIRLMIYDYLFTENDSIYPVIHLTSSVTVHESASRKPGPIRTYHITGHPCMNEEFQADSGEVSSGPADPADQDVAHSEEGEVADTQYRDSTLGIMPVILTCRAL
jgi:hypothetical protein